MDFHLILPRLFYCGNSIVSKLGTGTYRSMFKIDLQSENSGVTMSPEIVLPLWSFGRHGNAFQMLITAFGLRVTCEGANYAATAPNISEWCQLKVFFSKITSLKLNENL